VIFPRLAGRGNSFTAAQQRKLVTDNPSVGIAASVRANVDRFHYVTQAVTRQHYLQVTDENFKRAAGVPAIASHEAWRAKPQATIGRLWHGKREREKPKQKCPPKDSNLQHAD